MIFPGCIQSIFPVDVPSSNRCYLEISQYLFHHDPINFLLQFQHFLLQRQNVGVEDWFPQRPHFLQLCQLLYFGPVKIYAQNCLQAPAE